jgi:predicted nucleotidyltransferase
MADISSIPLLGVTPHEWEQVCSILREQLHGKRVWAFGSRASGRRLKRFSDLDLAVEGKLTWPERAQVSDAFEESLLPFKVDVVELDMVDADFRERIVKDFVLVQPGDTTDQG